MKVLMYTKIDTVVHTLDSGMRVQRAVDCKGTSRVVLSKF